ncbi:DUF5786 family protein [Halorubrum vacuolatum]|nr:DUF5786 family protein [Halorubrum vacuolatum]
MGFGSYDEAEQGNRPHGTDVGDDDAIETSRETHRGSVEYEPGASTDELLDRLAAIKTGDDADEPAEP